MQTLGSWLWWTSQQSGVDHVSPLPAVAMCRRSVLLRNCVQVRAGKVMAPVYTQLASLYPTVLSIFPKRSKTFELPQANCSSACMPF